MERRADVRSIENVNRTRAAAVKAGEVVQRSNILNSKQNKYDFDNAVYEFERVALQAESLKAVGGLNLVQYEILDAEGMKIISTIAGTLSDGKIAKIKRYEALIFSNNNKIGNADQGEINWNKYRSDKHVVTIAIVDGNKMPKEETNKLYGSVIGALEQRNRDEKMGYYDIPDNQTAETFFNSLRPPQKRKYIPTGISEFEDFSPLKNFPRNKEIGLFPVGKKPLVGLVWDKISTRQKNNPVVVIWNISSGKIEYYGGGTTACDASRIKNSSSRLVERLIASPQG